jgi:uncharacterized membrane protein YsdA (DUF1294 family)
MGAPKRSRPYRFHAITALVLSAAGTVGLWWGLEANNTWPVWLCCWLVAVNAVMFAYYAYDKVCAHAGAGRVPEAVLHLLSAVGGSPAALLAMWLLRHKTIKGSFRILFWAIVVLQACVLAYLLKWWLSPVAD